MSLQAHHYVMISLFSLNAYHCLHLSSHPIILLFILLCVSIFFFLTF